MNIYKTCEQLCSVAKLANSLLLPDKGALQYMSILVNSFFKITTETPFIRNGSARCRAVVIDVLIKTRRILYFWLCSFGNLNGCC